MAVQQQRVQQGKRKLRTRRACTRACLVAPGQASLLVARLLPRPAFRLVAGVRRRRTKVVGKQKVFERRKLLRVIKDELTGVCL